MVKNINIVIEYKKEFSLKDAKCTKEQLEKELLEQEMDVWNYHRINIVSLDNLAKLEVFPYWVSNDLFIQVNDVLK